MITVVKVVMSAGLEYMNLCSERRLASAFENSGAMSLYDDGMEKVRQGLTTIAEVLRVTESYKQNPGEDLADNS